MPTLLHTSIAASPLILLLAVTRPFLKGKVPPRVFLALYMLVLGRLLMPVWIPVSNTQIKPLLNPIYGGVFNFTRLAVAAAPSQQLLVVVWSAAALGLLGFVLFRHLRSLLVWRVALPLERPEVQAWVKEHAGWRKVRVVMIDKGNDVFSYGLFHPVIVMCPEMVEGRSDLELKQMAAHELAHIRGLHTMLQYGVLAVCSLHWFNPLVWLLSVLIGRDMELAADASAKRYLGPKEAKGYARMLLNLSEKSVKRQMAKSLFAPSLVERIQIYVGFKKSNIKLTVIIIFVTIVVFGVLSAVPVSEIRIDKRHVYTGELTDSYFERLENNGYAFVLQEPIQ